MKRRIKAWLALTALVVAVACGAKHDVHVELSAGASGARTGGAASGGSRAQAGVSLGASDAVPEGGGAIGAGAPSVAAGAPSLGGAFEAGGAGGVPQAGGGPDAGPGDAGAPPHDCTRGTVFSTHMPADCHATVCDGLGGTFEVIELENRPLAKGDCWVGYCDAQGNPRQAPSAAGSICQSAGGKLCDGAGACVACLTQSDCATGECIDHACVPNACSNGKRDGTETDLDCGGFCEQCGVGQSCKIDQDCGSDSCEQVKQVCLPATCIDQKLTSGETDVDCGGPDCSPCYLGKHCEQNSDCVTNQCNAQKLCEGEPCIDKRLDGYESDVDCGGFYCHWCKAGQRCNANYDCAPGHYCDDKQQPAVCVPYPP